MAVTAKDIGILKISALRLRKNQAQKNKPAARKKDNHPVSSDTGWLSSFSGSQLTVEVKKLIMSSLSPQEKAKKSVEEFYKLPISRFQRDYDFLAHEFPDED